MSHGKDPIGKAIQEFTQTGISKDIIVRSDICDDDVIPSAYFFRTFEEMPEIEQVALSQCQGAVLDVGAAAGCHVNYLLEKGINVEAIDISEGAIQYLHSQEINAHKQDFFDAEGSFDTLLMLMNGIGIARRLSNLRMTLEKAKSLLSENGKILCDSSDIKYLYEDEEGGTWVDLSSEYYGNFNFQMVYDDQQTEWFEWLYVDFDTLKEVASSAGLEARIVFQEEDSYLAELIHTR